MITGWQVLRKQVKSPSSDRAECGGNNHDYANNMFFVAVENCHCLKLESVFFQNMI